MLQLSFPSKDDIHPLGPDLLAALVWHPTAGLCHLPQGGAVKLPCDGETGEPLVLSAERGNHFSVLEMQSLGHQCANHKANLSKLSCWATFSTLLSVSSTERFVIFLNGSERVQDMIPVQTWGSVLRPCGVVQPWGRSHSRQTLTLMRSTEHEQRLERRCNEMTNSHTLIRDPTLISLTWQLIALQLHCESGAHDGDTHTSPENPATAETIILFANVITYDVFSFYLK